MTGEEFAANYNTLDFDAIRQEVDAQEWQPPENIARRWANEWDADIYEQERSVFLGTVFALTPSGKFYMPWACSNIQVCRTCQKAGNYQPLDEECDCEGGEPCEAWQDGVWYQYVDRELEVRGLFLQNGEGDPCDLFAIEYRSEYTN